MSRPKKKPNYNPEQVMKEFMDAMADDVLSFPYNATRPLIYGAYHVCRHAGMERCSFCSGYFCLQKWSIQAGVFETTGIRSPSGRGR